ncbi:MAG: response regulator transcription factor [Rhodothermales bacterium]
MKILIVDDHPVVREGLSELLSHEPDITVAAAARDAEEAIDVLRSTPVDLVVLDLSLPGLSGTELIRQIRSEFGDLPVLVLSMHEEQFYAERALRAGAHGYIMKQEPTEKLVGAIRKIYDGDLFVSDDVARRMLLRVVAGEEDGDSPVSSLSGRELEVFQLIGQGYGTRVIAEMLNLSIKTIESYRANLKQKLSLKNASELVQYAVKWKQHNLPS